MAVNNIYIAPTAQGTASGLNCANALAYTYFNTAGNWTSGTPTGVQIGPGSTVHLCSGTYGSGSITSASILMFQGSGTSGNPVTLIADQGAATLTATFYGSGAGGIDTEGHSFLTIDGQCPHNARYGVSNSNCLVIQSTANGTNLANQVDGGNGIRAFGGSNVTIQNVYVGPIYQHQCTLVNNGGNQAVNCTDTVGTSTGVISGNGSNLLIQWITGTYGKDCLGLNYSGGATITTVEARNFLCQNIGHGVEVGITNSGSTLTNLYVHDGHIQTFQPWDTSSTLSTFHNDGVHLFSSGGGTFTNGTVFIYNIIIDGDFGFSFNSGFFNEPTNGPGAFTYFNNVVNDQETPPFTHQGGCGYFCSEVNNVTFYNNTVIKSNSGTEDAFNMYGTGNIGKNNIVISAVSATHVESGATVTAWDYNTYYTIGSNGWGQFGSFSGWQTGTTCNGGGCDTHGQNGNNPNLNSSYVPNTGSPVIGFATSLFSVCNGGAVPGIGALCSDAAGNVRPTSGNWDGGAFDFITGTGGSVLGTLKSFSATFL